MEIEDFLSRLNNVKQSGSGWVALCPAHSDKRPSLSISEGEDGKILLHCHAGCSPEAVCAAIGLTLKDLCPELEQKPHRLSRIAKTYDYQDAGGNLLFQVCRMTPKDFRQRQPCPKGGDCGEVDEKGYQVCRQDPDGKWWHWNLKGVRRVLYRLPKVIEALESGQPVYVVEGEKDVHSLEKIGLVATTNPGGAGKWRPEYSDYLRGARVIVCPDADEPGRRHARQVAQSLYGKASSVKVLELPGLPEKGDVSDWLKAGNTKEKLLELVQECPEWVPEGSPKPIIVRLSEVEPEEVGWLWRPYIPLGKLTIVEGDPGVGKTWLALQLAAIVSRGDPFPGPDGVPRDRREPATVVYMTAEDGLADTLRPRLDTAGADVSRVFALTGRESVDLETGEKRIGGVTLADLPVIEATLKQVRPVMLVVDPLQAYLGKGVDMHRANEVRPILAGLAALAERYRCAVLCIRHLGKSPQDRAIYRGLGSIDFSAAARSVLLVGQHPGDEYKSVMAQSKNSLAAKGISIAFELREDRFWWCGIADVSAEALLAPARSEEEKNAVDEAVDFLQEALGGGPRPAKEVLKEARKCGIAERTIDRAKPKAGVRARRQGEPGKRGGGTWYWDLEGREGDLNKTSLRALSGDLNQNPQSLLPQGIQGTDLERRMTPLINDPQSLLSQGIQDIDLERQDVPLGEDKKEREDSALNREVFDL